jgi:hypothetical protein
VNGTRRGIERQPRAGREDAGPSGRVGRHFGGIMFIAGLPMKPATNRLAGAA